MFVALVALGNTHHLSQTDPSITGPPAGCHSIIASQGATLDDEAIVYDSRAALPRYLVVYKC